ncbi:hypothetical protein Aph02nite_08910 [Actinoplanes philippinensis]|nr:hypothetical protein Aph02nite_08910 [Actinoplanes philippinensis]
MGEAAGRFDGGRRGGRRGAGAAQQAPGSGAHDGEAGTQPGWDNSGHRRSPNSLT